MKSITTRILAAAAFLFICPSAHGETAEAPAKALKVAGQLLEVRPPNVKSGHLRRAQQQEEEGEKAVAGAVAGLARRDRSKGIEQETEAAEADKRGGAMAGLVHVNKNGNKAAVEEGEGDKRVGGAVAGNARGSRGGQRGNLRRA